MRFSSALCINKEKTLKRSKKEWFLIVFFVWAVIKSAGSLYGYEDVSDYTIFSSLKAPWAFFIINGLIALLELSTAIFLISRKSFSYISGVALSAVACINGVVVTTLAIKNIELVKSLYVASREARGMTVNAGQIDTMFSQQGLMAMLFAYIVFYVIIVVVLGKVRKEINAKDA